jgi:hypothetical protein
VTAAGDYVMQAILADNQTITSGSDITIQLTDQYDPQNWFNTSNYRFTPNIAGYYLIAFGVWYGVGTSATSDQINVQINKNGNTSMSIAQEVIPTGVSGRSVTG